MNGGESAPDRPMRPFWVLWTGQALSLVGSYSVQFALIWWLTQETGSAAVLASATFVGLFPQIALGPFIGTLVDRWNRKTIMFVSDAVVAGASLPLAVVFFLGDPRIELVLLILFVRAMGSAFHSPAMIASTSLMVPQQHLTRIQGLNQSLQGSLAGATVPMGLLIAAPVADLLGVRAWYALGGASRLTMGLMAFLVPAILEIEGHARTTAEPDAISA